MTLWQAEEFLRNLPSGGVRHIIIANEDGSFSIVEPMIVSESDRLNGHFYDTVVVATNKMSRPGDFLGLVQATAAEPITLRNLIYRLIVHL